MLGVARGMGATPGGVGRELLWLLAVAAVACGATARRGSKIDAANPW